MSSPPLLRSPRGYSYHQSIPVKMLQDACYSGEAYLRHKVPQEAWAGCKDSGWMLWALGWIERNNPSCAHRVKGIREMLFRRIFQLWTIRPVMRHVDAAANGTFDADSFLRHTRAYEYVCGPESLQMACVGDAVRTLAQGLYNPRDYWACLEGMRLAAPDDGMTGLYCNVRSRVAVLGEPFATSMLRELIPDIMQFVYG